MATRRGCLQTALTWKTLLYTLHDQNISRLCPSTFWALLCLLRPFLSLFLLQGSNDNIIGTVVSSFAFEIGRIHHRAYLYICDSEWHACEWQEVCKKASFPLTGQVNNTAVANVLHSFQSITACGCLTQSANS